MGLPFPLHIYLPLGVMPEGGWRIRYTSPSPEPVTQAKLGAYAAAGADFGTYDECLPDASREIVDSLFATLGGEEFVGAMLAIGTNRRCELTLESGQAGSPASEPGRLADEDRADLEALLEHRPQGLQAERLCQVVTCCDD